MLLFPNKQARTLNRRQDSHLCGLHRETVHELGLFGCRIGVTLTLDPRVRNSAGWGEGGHLCGLRRERDYAYLHACHSGWSLYDCVYLHG